MFLHRGFAFLNTFLAKTIHHHLVFLCKKTFWQLYLWYAGFWQAGGYTTFFTEKMNVIVVMMALFAFFPTKRILDSVICGGHRMKYPLFKKNLQGSVYGYPVKLVFQRSFNVCMGKGCFV